MQINKPFTAVLIAFISLILLVFSGCQDPLRFAPTESQKLTAESTHSLAVKVNAEGTQPASPASQKIVQGTQAALSYIGRPATPPDAKMFDTVASQASQDAIQRPDPWTVADNLLDLGIGISMLLGGVYGTKAVGYLRQAREKSQALKEVIQNNELFLGNADATAKSNFKQYQKKQSLSTKRLVTELKT